MGLHVEKVKSLVRHAEFRPWLATASRRIMRALSAAQPGGTVNIVTGCRKGAHRSVSAAFVLQRVLESNFKFGGKFDFFFFTKFGTLSMNQKFLVD